MAFLPITHTLPQYVDLNGDPYSGAVLKAYSKGTSTNINFATDNTGATLVASIALNASGYPEVSGSQVLPHLEEDYKLSLYPTQAAADADTGAIWTIDNITAFSTSLGGSKLSSMGNGTLRDDAITVGQVQDSEFTSLGTTGGSADAYTATPSPTITAYVSTMRFSAKIHATNATTTPYLQISGIGTPASDAVIKKFDGAGNEVTLESGDLTASQIYKFHRNSANNAWIVENPEKPARLNLGDGGELTIATGAITITQSRHTIDTESDAATDDLDTINGGTTGQIIVISSEADARDVVIKHATGNIITETQTDITLGLSNDKMILQYDGSNWVVISRSVNIDFLSSQAADGYTYLPNGLILQWGEDAFTIAHGATRVETLPITFPNNNFQVVAYVGNTVTTVTSVTYCPLTAKTTSNFTFQYGATTGGSYSVTLRYFAIGN